MNEQLYKRILLTEKTIKPIDWNEKLEMGGFIGGFTCSDYNPEELIYQYETTVNKETLKMFAPMLQQINKAYTGATFITEYITP